MKINKLIILIIIIILLTKCSNPDITIVVKHADIGILIIDNKPLLDLVNSKKQLSDYDTIFNLKLNIGIHELKLFINSSVLIDTTFTVIGDTYMYIEIILAITTVSVISILWLSQMNYHNIETYLSRNFP